MTSEWRTRWFAYACLACVPWARRQGLGEPLVRAEFQRQVPALAVSSLPVIVGLALLTGVVVVTQAGAWVGAGSALTQQGLFWGVCFELAPLLSALVLLARSGVTMVSELALMDLRGEFTALRRMGVPMLDYLVMPRVLAVTVSLPVLVLVFQLCAVVGGWLAATLLQGQSLPYLAGRFLEQTSPWLLALSWLKSALAGCAVGAILVHHGGSGARDAHAISVSAVHAVGNGLMAVFLVDAAVALTLYFLR